MADVVVRFPPPPVRTSRAATCKPLHGNDSPFGAKGLASVVFNAFRVVSPSFSTTAFGVPPYVPVPATNLTLATIRSGRSPVPLWMAARRSSKWSLNGSAGITRLSTSSPWGTQPLHGAGATKPKPFTSSECGSHDKHSPPRPSRRLTPHLVLLITAYGRS